MVMSVISAVVAPGCIIAGSFGMLLDAWGFVPHDGVFVSILVNIKYGSHLVYFCVNSKL